MEKPYSPAPDIDVIPTIFEIPGYGFIPINAFLLKAKEPVLVDTGYTLESETFMDTLRSLIDPADLKWIYLTHTDHDHIGSLHSLLDEVPHLRVITTFLAVGKMTLHNPLPMDRVYFLNPGHSLDLGDRTIRAIKPPSFDAPETTGFYDDGSGTLFSSDCFGALLSSPPGQSAADIPEQALKEGQTLWSTIDAPWLHKVDAGIFATELKKVNQIQPKLLLSSHLPAADGRSLSRFVDTLSAAPKAQPFVGPDQEGLQAMLAQMTG
jgi:flavorubredoxin